MSSIGIFYEEHDFPDQEPFPDSEEASFQEEQIEPNQEKKQVEIPYEAPGAAAEKTNDKVERTSTTIKIEETVTNQSLETIQNENITQFDKVLIPAEQRPLPEE